MKTVKGKIDMLATNEKILSSALKSHDSEKIEKAFEHIYNDYYKLVNFCIAKYVTDNETIKDLSQDVFLSFFENADNVHGSIKSFLCICAKNKALDYIKKENRCFLVDDMNLLIEQKEISSAAFYIEVMNDFKSILNEKELEIVELHAIEGYSFKEIGDHLQISANNANIIYYRALKKFKNSEKGKQYEKR